MPRDDIRLIRGDLTLMTVDAIVNPAHPSLPGDGAISQAIDRAAGPELRGACRLLGGCEVGEAKITPGFDLAARWVIHTAPPVWQGGGHGERGLLGQCYRSVLALGASPVYRITTIAFPAFSAGPPGFPAEDAADIAIDEADRFQASRLPFRQIIFVLFSEKMLETYAWAARGVLE
jgi:O-acetyl-ADP-ribose deacetylase